LLSFFLAVVRATFRPWKLDANVKPIVAANGGDPDQRDVNGLVGA
jgi:hypothetical protein